MVFQFFLCQRKIIKQRGKKLSVTELLTFTKGSVSFQAISSPDRFLAISVQLRTAKIMWDDPKDSWNIRYACIWIFQTKYFHECNHMKEKKKKIPHTSESPALHILESVYEPTICIGWILSFLVACMGFVQKSVFQLHWPCILPIIFHHMEGPHTLLQW